MIAEPTIAPLPPPIQIRSHAPSPNNAPASPAPTRPLKPFPLKPSDWWDDNPLKRVEYEFQNPNAPLYRAAVKVGIKHAARGRKYFIEVTLEELVKAIQWAWDERRETTR